MHHNTERLRGGAATDDDAGDAPPPIAPDASPASSSSGQRFLETDLAQLHSSSPPGTWDGLALASRWVETHVRIVLSRGRIVVADAVSSGEEREPPGSPATPDSNSSLSAHGPRGGPTPDLDTSDLENADPGISPPASGNATPENTELGRDF